VSEASWFTAQVTVRLRPGVLDPQGQAVVSVLRGLGFQAVEDVRVGRHVELRLRARDQAEAEGLVARICRDVLANPVLEDFRFTLQRDEVWEREPGEGR
jgi:phosphoribosylformylglycinamidine synthase PurS subunit